MAVCLMSGLLSCGRKDMVITYASEAIVHRNYDDALEAILSLRDKTIIQSDTLSQLLSMAYYGLTLKPVNAIAQDCSDMDFTPDGKSVIFTDFGTGDLNIYYYPELKFNRKIQVPDRAFSVAVSPDGNTLAAALANNTIRLYDLNTDKPIKTLFGHGSSVRDVEFLNDSIIFTCSNDRTVGAWNINHDIYFWPRRVSNKNIKSIALNKDHTKLVTASNDGSACVLDITDYTAPKELLRLVHGENYVNDAAFSPNGKYIVTVSGDGFLKIWNSSTGTLTKRIFMNDPLTAVDITDDSKRILVGGQRYVFVIDAEDGKILTQIQGTNLPVWGAKFLSQDAIAFTDNSRYWQAPLLTLKDLLTSARKLHTSH